MCRQKWQSAFRHWARDFSILVYWIEQGPTNWGHFFHFVLPPDIKRMKYQTQILQGRMFHLRRVGLTEGSTTQGYALNTCGAISVVTVIDRTPLAGISWQLMGRSQECHMFFNACDILFRTDFPTSYVIFKCPLSHIYEKPICNGLSPDPISFCMSAPRYFLLFQKLKF